MCWLCFVNQLIERAGEQEEVAFVLWLLHLGLVYFHNAVAEFWFSSNRLPYFDTPASINLVFLSTQLRLGGKRRPRRRRTTTRTIQVEKRKKEFFFKVVHCSAVRCMALTDIVLFFLVVVVVPEALLFVLSTAFIEKVDPRALQYPARALQW